MSQPLRAIDCDARARLAQALADIFEEHWKFADVVRACCAAQRELAARPRYRESVILQGWIVGKADNPHT
jgi:hypothetical protein